MDWAQQGAGIEESHRALQQENIELSKQMLTWRAKFETLQYVLLSHGMAIIFLRTRPYQFIILTETQT